MKADSYFIAVTLPPGLAEEVQKYRDSAPPYSAFKTPLHITLIPPFYPEPAEENLLRLLENNISILSPGKIVLDSVAYFEHRSSVAYLKPDAESEVYLQKLFLSVSTLLKDTVKPRFNRGSKPEDFHPHLTIAKRIPANKLNHIKELLKNFNDVFVFTVKTIDVYKQAESFGSWVKINEILLPLPG